MRSQSLLDVLGPSLCLFTQFWQAWVSVLKFMSDSKHQISLGRELLETDTLTAERKDSWSPGRKKKKQKGKKTASLEPLHLALKSPVISVSWRYYCVFVSDTDNGLELSRNIYICWRWSSVFTKDLQRFLGNFGSLRANLVCPVSQCQPRTVFMPNRK